MKIERERNEAQLAFFKFTKSVFTVVSQRAAVADINIWLDGNFKASHLIQLYQIGKDELRLWLFERQWVFLGGSG